MNTRPISGQLLGGGNGNWNISQNHQSPASFHQTGLETSVQLLEKNVNSLRAELDQTKVNINALYLHSQQLDERVNTLEKFIQTRQISGEDKLSPYGNDGFWDLS